MLSRLRLAQAVPALLIVGFLIILGCGEPVFDRTGSKDGKPRAPAGTKNASTDAKPGEPAKEQTLVEKLDDSIQYTLDARVLDPSRHAAWQVMHGILAFGQPFKIRVDGKWVNAVDWILAGGDLRGWDVRKGDVGLRIVVEPGSAAGQGHEDQWLSKLTHADLPTTHEVTVGGQKYTVADMVNQAMWDMAQGKEASWSLLALSYYLKPDQSWVAKDGKTWTVEDVIAMEASQDLNRSACGGSHRLYAMQKALNRYKEQHPGKPLTGGWAQANQRIRESIETIKSYQQPDGSFSTEWLVRPANSRDSGTRMGTTGHMLEFLAIALTDDELKEPWMEKAVNNLCDQFRVTKSLAMESGGLYHAVHGLILYRHRRFGPKEYEFHPPDGSSPAGGDSTGPIADVKSADEEDKNARARAAKAEEAADARDAAKESAAPAGAAPATEDARPAANASVPATNDAATVAP